MEHESSFNKQLRKEITATAVMNKERKMIEVNVDKKNKKLYVVDKDIKTVQKGYT